LWLSLPDTVSKVDFLTTEPAHFSCRRRNEEITQQDAIKTDGDIVEESQFKPAFTNFAGYFNLTKKPDRDKLFSLARDQKLDLAYDASWPSAHLLNLVNLESIFEHILVTKPFVSVEQYSGLEALMNLSGFECVREKILMHDHFTNKPSLTALISSLSQAHQFYGRFSRMFIIITEQRTVNDLEEVKRQEALTGGIDTGPRIACRDDSSALNAKRLDVAGGSQARQFFKRLDRHIEVTACVRAQMKLAALPDDVDTACIIEYLVTETLTLAYEDGTAIGRPFPNRFYALVVCGKGLSATSGIDRDLKALEISFQGQGRSTGVVDLETNTLNEVLERIPGIGLPNEDERAHRGINRPMMKVLERWKDFETNNILRAELFREKSQIWENMKMLSETMAVCKNVLFLHATTPWMRFTIS
jgi:hypothetical protein